MNELERYLEEAGFDARKPQTTLFEHLIQATRLGVVAQAGTGTGKSAAILAAASNMVHETGEQSIVITPTLTLMDQYIEKDVPLMERACPDLAYASLRGRAHYFCEQTKSGYDLMGQPYVKGCEGGDAGCTRTGWAGHDDSCAPGCHEEHPVRWRCDYQEAKQAAMTADVVVTNSDMLIVNDRILANLPSGPIFSMDGSLFVDEAHQLEQKLRDWASRSIWHKSLERFSFAGTAGPTLAHWVARQDNAALSATRGFPIEALRAIASATMPEAHANDGLSKQRETQEACARLLAFIEDPHDSAVAHVSQGSLKMDWINVAKSAGELLSQRSFGLVSATVPRTMAATLGVSDAPFVDVGHPFDYGTQAFIGFSPYSGSYRDAQIPDNFERRVTEVLDLIRRSKGGALILFSSFRDLEAVYDRIASPVLNELGLTLLKQEREDCDKAELARRFKADGNAVLLGSESFATGFDVPGNALRLVVVWKLPYPAVDAVSNAIRSQNFQRYEDAMRVRCVQAIGRLIRTKDDRGVVWMADSRARRLLDRSDPLTSHLPTFARL